jgi:hypothetical protein
LGHLVGGEHGTEGKQGDGLVDITSRLEMALLKLGGTDRSHELVKALVIAVLETKLAELCDAAAFARRLVLVLVPGRLDSLEKGALDGVCGSQSGTAAK